MSTPIAMFLPNGERGPVCFDLTPTGWAALLAEIELWVDPKGPSRELIGTVTIEMRPDGYVASLPEHGGW